MKANKTVFWILLVFVLIILTLFIKGFFVYREPISGVIKDTVTKEPISNIKVERLIALEQTKGPAGTDGYKLETYITYTDENGYFGFSKSIITKIPLLTWFDKEWVNINMQEGFNNINPENENYSIMGYKGGMASFIRPTEKNIEYYNIELAPIVNSLDECKNNSLCIEENSFDLALMNKDETLCANVVKSRESWDRFQQGKCYEMINAAKNNESPNCGHNWAQKRKELCMNLLQK